MNIRTAYGERRLFHVRCTFASVKRVYNFLCSLYSSEEESRVPQRYCLCLNCALPFVFFGLATLLLFGDNNFIEPYG